MTAAERTARWRERRAHGERVLPIPVSDELVDLLLADGFLGEWDSENREAITSAIEHMHALLIADATQRGRI